MPLYARILAHLAEGAATAREVSMALGTDILGTVRALRIMRKYELLHVVNWRREVAYGIPNEVWGPGPGRDAPPPLTQKGKVSKKLPNYSTEPISVEVSTFALVVRLMRETCTYHELVEKTGLANSALSPLVAQMRSLKLLHTCEWIRNPHGTPTPILRWGARFSTTERNAPKPQPMGKDPAKRLARQHREKFRNLAFRIASGVAPGSASV
jgi:hypothetical protein